MSTESLARKLRAFLAANHLDWSEVDGVYAIRFASAIVGIHLAPWGEQVLIQLRAHVLTEPESPPDRIVQRMNALNRETLFGRWVWYEEDRLIVLEYDLLGDHLQEPELMTALASVARLADRHDDLLKSQFGGRRATD